MVSGMSEVRASSFANVAAGRSGGRAVRERGRMRKRGPSGRGNVAEEISATGAVAVAAERSCGIGRGASGRGLRIAD